MGWRWASKQGADEVEVGITTGSRWGGGEHHYQEQVWVGTLLGSGGVDEGITTRSRWGGGGPSQNCAGEVEMG